MRWRPEPVCLTPATLGLLLLLSPGASAQQTVDSKTIDAILADALKAWNVPGAAVAIVHRDKVVYLKGFGVKELGSDKPVTPDTVFPIASCTKAFITTAMAMLVDEGKMGWDDPVRKHVAYFRLADPAVDAQVKLRDLVCHRTGLAGHDALWYRAPWSLEESIRRIGLVQPSLPFRASFQYQSIMFMAAGQAVAAASGKSWDRFVKERIFEPLEMNSPTTTTAEALKKPDHATPHRKDRKDQVEVIPWYAMDKPNPAGSISISARDLSKWVRFQLGDGTYRGKNGLVRLVSSANLEDTHTPQNIIRLKGPTRALNPYTTQLSYGMGWVIQDYRGHLLVSHAGAIDGFRAHLTLAPDDQLGIVLLNNLQGTDMNLAVSNSILDQVFRCPYKDWNSYLLDLNRAEEAAAKARSKEREAKRHTGTKPSRDLAAYTGTYEDPAYGTATISLEKGTLVWRWSSYSYPLEHYHFDTFTVKNGLVEEPLAVFSLGADGEVAVIRVMDRDFKKKR